MIMNPRETIFQKNHFTFPIKHHLNALRDTLEHLQEVLKHWFIYSQNFISTNLCFYRESMQTLIKKSLPIKLNFLSTRHNYIIGTNSRWGANTISIMLKEKKRAKNHDHYHGFFFIKHYNFIKMYTNDKSYIINHAHISKNKSKKKILRIERTNKN